MNKKVNILGVEFLHTTMNQFISTLSGHVERAEKAFVVTANPEIVMISKRDSEFKQIIDKADYVTADGIGIVKASQSLGNPLPERVSGYDIMLRLLQLSNEKQLKVYMVGAKQEIIEKAVANVRKSYPNVDVVGYRDGYFDLSDRSIIEDMKEKEPDFIFIALGCPRQEKWIDMYRGELDKGVCMGVGGSFDALSGEVKRAPNFIVKIHMEWLYRFAMQPTRLKRMLDIPRFMNEVRKAKNG